MQLEFRFFHVANMQTGELLVFLKALRHKDRNPSRGAGSGTHLQKASQKLPQVVCLTHTEAFPHSPETYQGPVTTAREQTHPAYTLPAFSFLHLSRRDSQLDKTFSSVDPESHVTWVWTTCTADKAKQTVTRWRLIHLCNGVQSEQRQETGTKAVILLQLLSSIHGFVQRELKPFKELYTDLLLPSFDHQLLWLLSRPS